MEKRNEEKMSMNVLDKIVEKKRMPVLFIGSGIPKRYLFRFPNWENLLKQSFYFVDKDPFFYHNYVDKFQREGLSQFEIYESLGTVIENEFNDAFYQRKISFGGKNPKWVKQGVSPYKMFVSRKFKNLRLYDSETNNKEIEEFRKLKNKISAVITTNYDRFIEKYIFDSDYTVFKRQYEMFSADSYNIAEIYKIHGCVTDADTIVITKNDYEHFQETRKLFIAKMLTLFAESPIIFLGYSLTDENIRSIITDFLDCLSPSDLENINEHLVFISWKENEQDLIESKNTIITSEGKQIPITEIQTDNYLKVYETLNMIVPGIAASKIRETRRIVKKIVDTSIMQGQEASVIVNIEDLDKISNSKALAVAVGYREDLVNNIGYKSFPDKFIYEDILFDNKNLDPYKVCFDKYASITHYRLLPIFKYAKEIPIEVKESYRLSSYISSKDSEEKIISNSFLRSASYYPIYDNLNSLRSGLNDYDKDRNKCILSLKNHALLDPESLRGICKDLLDQYSESLYETTEFKRCILFLDYLENCQEYKEKVQSSGS